MFPFKEGVTVPSKTRNAIGETTFPILSTGGFTGRGDSEATIQWMVAERS